jgi:hypothetical protein
LPRHHTARLAARAAHRLQLVSAAQPHERLQAFHDLRHVRALRRRARGAVLVQAPQLGRGRRLGALRGRASAGAACERTRRALARHDAPASHGGRVVAEGLASRQRLEDQHAEHERVALRRVLVALQTLLRRASLSTRCTRLASLRASGSDSYRRRPSLGDVRLGRVLRSFPQNTR